ncbi:MAG: cytochrome c biogenesis protein CcsA [Desulfovibrionaceae bacterium]|nr:cytochrome c biogenesis protein CcsA [Desulfovibrionaceae bacterium]
MIRCLILLATCMMGLTQYLIYNYAPLEATLGLSQKIFYIHLPLAWWGLMSFFLVFIASLKEILRPTLKSAALAQAAAEIGELFAVLTVISGMIWGRLAWGVWWTWDPRLTTALILCFIYAGYLLLSQVELPAAKRQKICAVCGILGFLDVPLVFFSARLWRSIHPALFTSKGAAMTQEMLVTLGVSLIGLGILWFAIMYTRYQGLITYAQLDTLENNQY